MIERGAAPGSMAGVAGRGALTSVGEHQGAAPRTCTDKRISNETLPVEGERAA
jgi:hypothetical protein